MAKQCSICGKQFGRFEKPDGIFGVLDMCNSCLVEVRDISHFANVGLHTSYFEAKEAFRIRHTESSCIEKLFENMEKAYDIKDNSHILAMQEEALRKDKEKAAALLLTTGSSFDGYRVEKYNDVVCEEIIFKNSFIKQLSAGFEDLGNAFSFQATEMTGANELISNARAALMDKFRLKAAQMGANAILGIDMETSFGTDVVRAAVNGTAVVIRKKEET